MLTPQFEIKQFDDYLLITIKAPYIKSNDVEIYIESNEFKFYVKPYFLRLYFPGDIIEDGREKAEYDVNTGVFKVEVPKKNCGEFFPDLDMLTTLLETKKKHMMKTIEVVEPEGQDDEKKDNENDEVEDCEIPSDDDLCWEVEQELFTPSELLNSYKYGFANRVDGVFSRLQNEMFEMIDVPDPDNTAPKDRKELRIKEETEKFDAQHYIADMMDDEIIQELINFQASWDIEYDRILDTYKKSYPETSDLINHKGNPTFFNEEEHFVFKEEEKERLIQLPNKDFILDKIEEHKVFLSLVDIIFGYVYDHRTTEGDSTSESPWTICKLTGTLSWLDTFTSLEDVLTTNARRSLCYPLYRHWSLIEKIIEDVRRIFVLGRRWILRCLLDIKSILQGDETKYILNELYITDLSIWIQKVKRKRISSIANKLQCIQVCKEDMNFDLDNVERTLLFIDDDLDGSSGESEDSDSSSSSCNDTSSDSSSTESESLDSDDVSEEETDIKPDITLPPLTISHTATLQPKIEVINSKDCDVPDDIEVIRTGLQELMTVQEKFVDGVDEGEAS